MTEQLRITQEKSIKLKQTFKAVLKSPLTYGFLIGGGMAWGGVADLFITSNIIDRKLDQDYPPEAVRLAREEIEVFNRDISGQPNPQTVQAFDIEQQRILKRRELESQATPRQVFLILGGTAIESVGITSAAISASRKRNEINKETSKAIVKG